MGTDINLYVEAKIKDKWQVVYGPDIYELETMDEIKELLVKNPLSIKKYSAGISDNNWYYNGRWGLLFGVLGGVEENIIPITGELRGLPLDVSKEIKDFFHVDDPDPWNEWCFGFNWIGAKELVDFDKTKIVKDRILYLDKEQYLNYKSGMKMDEVLGTDEYWKFGFYNSNIVISNNRIESPASDTIKVKKDRKLVTPVSFPYTYGEILKSLINKLPVFDGFAEPENIRFVFAFDN